MEDAAAVGVGDRLADASEPDQELAERAVAAVAGRLVCAGRAADLFEQLGQRCVPRRGVERRVVGRVKRGDRLAERKAPDEPHGVARLAVVAHPFAVDRDDARVFEPAVDPRFVQEPPPALVVAGVEPVEELERDVAVGLGVVRLIDLAHSPLAADAEVDEP